MIAKTKAKGRAKTSLQKDDNGEIISAETLTANNRKLNFAMNKRIDDKQKISLCTADFFQGENKYFSMAASISIREEKVTFEANGRELQMYFAIDFTDYDSTHKGIITGKINGDEFRGTYDPRKNKCTVNVALDNWLPDEVRRNLDYFAPVFKKMQSSHKDKSKRFQKKIDDTIHHSIWGTIGRAACWGFAGMGAAASCVATAGIGCPVAAGLFGAAASVCSDGYEGM